MNGCGLTLNPEGRGYYNIHARRSGHENLSRWPHYGRLLGLYLGKDVVTSGACSENEVRAA